jgi:hypothetical protein
MAVKELIAMKGHGFSRANKYPTTKGFSPEG